MSKLVRPEPLFFHFRARDSQNEVAPKGGATIVFDPIEKKFAVALCCPNDRFCKRTGAKIATHRLSITPGQQKNGRFAYVVRHGGDNEFKEVKAAAYMIAQSAAISVGNECVDCKDITVAENCE